MARFPLLAVAVCLALSPPGAAAAPAVADLPSAAEARGEGAGKVFVVPVTAAGPEQPLDAKLFAVHAAAPGSRAAVAGLEAGKWLALPAPELDLWLEGEGLVSPYSVRVARPAAGAAGQVVRIPVGAAGRVTAEFVVEGEVLRPELHLWSAGPFRDRAGQLQGELARVVPLPLQAPVAMPAGQVVAAIYEPSVDSYLMVSRPFEISGGETAKLEMEPEDTFAQLILDLPLLAPSAEGAKVDLQQAGTMEPDLIVQSRHRVTAFWYSLFPATEATLWVAAGDHLLPPRRQVMRGAVILAEHGPLVLWPELELELKVPAALNDRPLILEATGPSYKTHEKLEFTGDYRHTFRKLPPIEIELDLRTPLGRLSRRVDFSSGESQQVFWEPEPVTIEGTVFYDDKPSRAKLSFGYATRFETDAEGRYRAEQLGEVKFVQVQVDGVPGDPHVEILAEPMTASGRLDVRVPAVVFSVRVIDAASRQGIEFASLDMENTYRHEAKEGDDEPGPLQQIRQSVRTDEDGKAWLPPVLPGVLELQAEASGYLESKPLVVEVAAKAKREEFEFALEKIEALLPLELKLPDGAPASGAAVALFDPSGSFAMWRDMADREGRVEVPSAAGHLLASGSQASFVAMPWPPQDETRVLRLPPEAGTFLMLQVKDRQGRPFDGAHLALYLDGKIYRGELLGFLIQAPAVTNQGGLLIARHLPPRPFGLVAYSQFSPGPPAGAVPVQVPYPWPHLIELRLAE